MKICVVNGSPRGKYSVTIHTSLYIEKKWGADDEFNYLNVGQGIKGHEKNFARATEALTNADLIVFSYPVYTFLVPYQLHRFFELIKENKVDLTGKMVTQICTSKHFYDVTAHNFVKENCFDLGMNYIKGLSADMDDLTRVKGQQEVDSFWSFVKYSAENKVFEQPIPRVASAICESQAEIVEVQKVDSKKRTIIITNIVEGDTKLRTMIDDYKKAYKYPTVELNIANLPLIGGCLGCFGCTGTAQCVYKDGFQEFYLKEVLGADAIVYAFTIKDHSMGATFKRYDDRQFFNGHRTMSMGVPVAYVINGDYYAEHNLRTVVEARAEVGHNYMAGVIIDNNSMLSTVAKVEYAMEKGVNIPPNFYGVGGMKIFRDLIYIMRGMMSADHKFYKAHGFYDDLPQKQKTRMIMMLLVGRMYSNPKIKAKMGSKLNEGIVMPYKKVLDSIK
ncbi:MAG: NAD(P)H-dependent oxidoreductase [Bacillota bacterium]